MLAFRNAVIACLAVLSVAVVGSSASSQIPKTVKFVVPFSPGGGADILARLLADQIGRLPGGPAVIVENRPGAGTVIGTEAVSRAVPDGGTVLINTANMIIAPHLRKLSYDPLTSFEPVCHLVDTPMFVLVNATSPYRTLSDLVDAAHAKPGALTFASVGPATTLHITLERFKRVANLDMTYVPFPGTAPAVNALLGGHVTAIFGEHPAVVEQVKSGRLRALATASGNRVEPLTEVPTIAESGYQDFAATVWFSAVAPAKTPPEAIADLARWFNAAMQSPDTKPKLIAQGMFPNGTCGAGFGTHLRQQFEEYGRVIRDANVKAE